MTRLARGKAVIRLGSVKVLSTQSLELNAAA
jgi:hypothetical protein